jgi:hypothetical protein
MKKIIIIALALAFVISASTSVMASRVKCTVGSVEGQTVTLTCKDADKLKAGDRVTVRTAKAKKAIEGC